MSASTLEAPNARLRSSSVVVPASTATFWPPIAAMSFGPVERMMKLAPSTNVAMEKPSDLRRRKVTVVASHSRSALPPVIASKRLVDVTGT